ncbi:MAG: 1-deoxy-D-xylulose-5-phosphate synthase N-terminal domain-containing protein [Bacteroidota bacterium]
MTQPRPAPGDLRARALAVKRRFLAMYAAAHAGHVGSSLSCTEMLVHLRFAWMEPEDELVLSKGHAAAVLYAVLAEAGMLPPGELDTFSKDGTLLSAHPPLGGIRGIPFATGSLGHGLSLAAGMALAARLRGERKRFFCVTSDGELDEGSVWEAALFIHHHGLRNLVWLIDRNMLQGIGRTEEVLALEPLGAKLEAFGFHAVTADGHDFTSLARARELCCRDEPRMRPRAVICATRKGRGIEGLEDTVDCHYLPLTPPQHAQVLRTLEAEEKERGEGHEG